MIYVEQDPLTPPRPVTAAFKGDWSGKSREKAEESGEAMEGGSFPIKDKEDLQRAIKAIGRAKDPEKAKAHIKKRAMALGATDLIPDSWKVEKKARAASGLAIPEDPPSEWFKPPELDGVTPLTVTADGRVYGHIAPWHVDHIGLPGRIKPPRSASGYAFFHTGEIQTSDDRRIPVGQLTLAGGHAPLQADAGAAVKHYDDTASAVADVAAGEDKHGIWVAGALRPGTTRAQIRALRASAPSGDWRPINGNLEMVAVCQVNVPGYPVARARVASGSTLALVAAGARAMYERRLDQLSGKAELEARVAALEARQREYQRAELRRRVAGK